MEEADRQPLGRRTQAFAYSANKIVGSKLRDQELVRRNLKTVFPERQSKQVASIIHRCLPLVVRTSEDKCAPSRPSLGETPIHPSPLAAPQRQMPRLRGLRALDSRNLSFAQSTILFNTLAKPWGPGKPSLPPCGNKGPLCMRHN